VLSGLQGGLFYSALTVFLGASVVGFRVVAGSRKGRALRSMLAVGAVLLTLLLANIAWREGYFPVRRRYEALVFSAWVLAVLVGALDLRLRMTVLTAVAAPTFFLLLLFAILLAPVADADAPPSSLGKASHIVLATLGLAAFALSAAVGALYVWQIRVLKHNPTAAAASRMPSLEVLDRVNFLLVAFGFPFLALSVLSGWLFIASGPDRAYAWWLDPTVLVTLSGLILYALLFGARSFLGWYGRRIAWLTLIGFFLIVGGFVIARFCTSGHVLHTS